jgi:hypothetical protein
MRLILCKQISGISLGDIELYEDPESEFFSHFTIEDKGFERLSEMTKKTILEHMRSFKSVHHLSNLTEAPRHLVQRFIDQLRKEGLVVSYDPERKESEYMINNILIIEHAIEIERARNPGVITSRLLELQNLTKNSHLISVEKELEEAKFIYNYLKEVKKINVMAGKNPDKAVKADWFARRTITQVIEIYERRIAHLTDRFEKENFAFNFPVDSRSAKKSSPLEDIVFSKSNSSIKINANVRQASSIDLYDDAQAKAFVNKLKSDRIRSVVINFDDYEKEVVDWVLKQVKDASEETGRKIQAVVLYNRKRMNESDYYYQLFQLKPRAQLRGY